MIYRFFYSLLPNLVPDALILLGILNRGDGNVDRTLPTETSPSSRPIMSPTPGQTSGGFSRSSSHGLFVTPARSHRPSRHPSPLRSCNSNDNNSIVELSSDDDETGSNRIVELDSDDGTNANAFAWILVGHEQETSYRDAGSRSRRGSEGSLSESRKRDWAEAMREEEELEAEEAEVAKKRKRVTAMIESFGAN